MFFVCMNAGQPPSRSGTEHRRPTVLVVEDEVLLRMSVAEYLRDCGFHVVEAGNADEALRVLEADVEVDVVFSDVQMPGSIDGLALAQWLRRERPQIELILTSGVARTAEAARDLCEEARFLAKPYQEADLESRIRALLGVSSRTS